MALHLNQKGFTLIEIMISIAIFAIGYLAVAAMHTRALNFTTSSRITTEAIELASAHAEYLYGLPFYEATPSGPDDDGEFHSDLEEGDHSTPEDRYGIEWEVMHDKPILPYFLEKHPDSDNNNSDVEMTVSMTIEIRVFENRNQGKILAEMEIVKIWESDEL